RGCDNLMRPNAQFSSRRAAMTGSLQRRAGRRSAATTRSAWTSILCPVPGTFFHEFPRQVVNAWGIRGVTIVFKGNDLAAQFRHELPGIVQKAPDEAPRTEFIDQLICRPRAVDCLRGSRGDWHPNS